MEHRRRPRLVQPAVCRKSAAIRDHLKPWTVRNSRKPASTASPPTEAHVPLGLLVAYEGMRWSPAPMPTPRKCPPVPAPRQRPPVPAPRQRPPVPAQTAPSCFSAGPVQLSVVPAGPVQLHATGRKLWGGGLPAMEATQAPRSIMATQASPWPPESPDPPWPSKLPAPPWPPESPDPPWPPKLPAPPWPPESPDPPWLPEWALPWRPPARATGPLRPPEHPPPLPFRCYTARDAPIGRGGGG